MTTIPRTLKPDGVTTLKAETRAAREATYQVEVKLRPEYPDAAGAEALSLLSEAGLNTAKTVRVSQIYEIKGPLNNGHIQQAARELLCDNVTQEFRIAANVPVLNGMNYWRVEVWLKATVSDPVGETVLQAISELGLPAPQSVRRGLVYHISGKCGRNHIEKAAQRCLINPVIHRFTVSEAHS